MDKKYEKYSIWKLMPVLFSFFVMGFVDVVNVATSYVKNDFALSNTLSNLLPMMVFLWFAVCSLPTGLLMRSIGRKPTVLVSAVITSVAMFIPMLSYTFFSTLLTFALLGIGNTILQVSLNPLLMDVVSKKKVTSTLTLGYFIKAISSTLGPIIIGGLVGFWGNWQLVFPIYGCMTIISLIWLYLTSIPESQVNTEKTKISLLEIVSLFRIPMILISFSIIFLSVGFEVGLMTVVPKYLLERCAMPLEQGVLGCSLYFAARTLGTFVGVVLLMRVSGRKFLILNVGSGILFFLLFMIFENITILMISLFGIGFFCANIFPVTLSAAIQYAPQKSNEISAVMIMGVVGGAVLPLIMGMVSDLSNQWTSLFIPLSILIYILLSIICLKKMR